MWRHEDIFFGAFGGGGIANPISRPDEIAERAQSGLTRCLPACPFMHGTAHWMAFMTLYEGGTGRDLARAQHAIPCTSGSSSRANASTSS